MARSHPGSKSRRLKAGDDSLISRTSTIPGCMRAKQSLDYAHKELEKLANLAGEGVLVERRGRSVRSKKHATADGDVLANLWFVRAVHEYIAAAHFGTQPAGEAEHLEFAARKLMPICKKIVQTFITQGMDSVRMDDGGMLAAEGEHVPKSAAAVLAARLRLNCLWYSALEATGVILRGPRSSGHGFRMAAHDTAGDHFERLAGRFRRSFSKMYWCDEHDRICPPETRELADHGTIPDPEQLLLMILPASPLARTKQRNVLTQLEPSAVGIGVVVRHAEHGDVESPLHRAWLAQAIANTADTAVDEDRAAAVARGLAPLREAARTSLVHGCYQNGKALGKADPLASAEVLGTIQRFLGDGA